MARPPRVSGYKDLVEIGRGGFAVVYRALQVSIDRPVALKVLTRPDLSSEDQRRFEKECAAMGRLSQDPNIVVVYDAGVTDEGYPYLAMEYLEAGSLADRLTRDGAVPSSQVVLYGIELADALEKAHEAGVLHRDIKPDNVLLGDRGHAKLGDFGIAAILGSTRTATGLMTATVAHAAPEVLSGGRASAASDIYSLGSTLYELASGRPAFVRDGDESIVPIVMRVTTEPVPDLRDQGVPDPAADVIEAAMTKEPADRPSASELGDALRAVDYAPGGAAADPVSQANEPTISMGPALVGPTVSVPVDDMDPPTSAPEHHDHDEAALSGPDEQSQAVTPPAEAPRPQSEPPEQGSGASAAQAGPRVVRALGSIPEPEGSGCGKALLLLGILVIALLLVLVAMAAIRGSTPDSDETALLSIVDFNGEESHSPGDRVAVRDALPGDCTTEDLTKDGPWNFVVVDCDQPHRAEFFASGLIRSESGEEFPGDSQITDSASSYCRDALDSYTGDADSEYLFWHDYPTLQTWRDGDRSVVCYVPIPAGKEMRSGSLADA